MTIAATLQYGIPLVQKTLDSMNENLAENLKVFIYLSTNSVIS